MCGSKLRTCPGRQSCLHSAQVTLSPDATLCSAHTRMHLLCTLCPQLNWHQDSCSSTVMSHMQMGQVSPAARAFRGTLLGPLSAGPLAGLLQLRIVNN